MRIDLDHWHRTLLAKEEAEAERDRLRALVVYRRGALGSFLGEVMADLSFDRQAWPDIPDTARQALADLDGQAAEAWLREREEKAAEPWKALVAFAPSDWATGVPDELLKDAQAWLASERQKAREEGRAEGLREGRLIGTGVLREKKVEP